MAGEWPSNTVISLQREGALLVEDGNHGEYRPRSDEFVDDGVAFIRAADMDSGRVLFDRAARINQAARDRITKGIGRPGDVLLSHKGTVGKVALVPLDAPAFVCSPQTTFWRTLDEGRIDRRYLYVFLRSQYFQSQLAARAGETDMAPYVSLTSQRGLSVVLPPIDVQRAIAHILGTLDDKIELNRRMNETLEAIARAIFKSWFLDFDPVRAKASGEPAESICRRLGLTPDLLAEFPDRLVDSELGEIPEGWEVKPLPSAIQVNPYRALRKGDVAPYLDMSSMPTTSARALAVAQREFGSGTKFSNGDTLLARITPCLENGKTCFVDFLGEDQVGWGSTEYVILHPMSPLPAEYAYFLARTDAFRRHAIANMTGTSGRQRVPVSAFDDYRLVVPSEGICREFGDLASSTLTKMKASDAEALTLSQLRDALLPRLLSGELRVPLEGAA